MRGNDSEAAVFSITEPTRFSAWSIRFGGKEWKGKLCGRAIEV